MSYTWCAGKKSATSLDHWSYYMIVGVEVQLHDEIVARRTQVFSRWPPLNEENYQGREPAQKTQQSFPQNQLMDEGVERGSARDFEPQLET